MIGAIILMVVAPTSAAPAVVMNEKHTEARRLQVGDTGIDCVRLPCPSRGVFEPDERGFATRDRLLYVDLDGKTPPPPMIGDKADQSEVVKAWNDRRCLAIEGGLIPGEDGRPALRVDRIIGPCGGEG